MGFVAVGVFVFPNSLARIVESGRDFGLSIAFYFVKLFRIPNHITLTVNEMPKLFFVPAPTTDFPDRWGDFVANWTAFWRAWSDKNNIFGYLRWCLRALNVTAKFLPIVVMGVVIVVLLIKYSMTEKNNKYNVDSKPLVVAKWIYKKVYSPVKWWVLSFVEFVKANKAYWVIWSVLWLFYFNVFTVILEFCSFYVYFAVTFDFANIYTQVYKLVLDLTPMFRFVPVPVWVVVALLALDRWRKDIGYKRLYHFERRNRGFINERPLGFMLTGTMGARKTTIMTDMLLSLEVMFRDKLLNILYKADLKFPSFPWINLEKEIQRAMEYHQIYSLATAREWVYKKAARWDRARCPDKMFGYEYDEYGYIYDDCLKLTSVWGVIETYTQAYFAYIIKSTFIVSNYGVRLDNALNDLGNFPTWDNDFFRRDSRDLGRLSHYSHIIDFDFLRLGKKVVERNPNADAFEFGIVAMSEGGKERGNAVENADKKKKDETANPKNDLFNLRIKMGRHSATVDYEPFVRYCLDENRAESLGADARELFDIVHVAECSDTKLTMPFFTLGELLHTATYDWFNRVYYKYRFYRGDNTLLMAALKAFAVAVNNHYTRIYNRFGYAVAHTEVEKGTMDGALSDGKYYLMSKKIYSDRFSTDCFADFFSEKALRSERGIGDLPTYSQTRATFEEMQKQNSYFVNDLLKGLDGDDKEKND